MVKTAEEASKKLMEYRNLLMEDPSTSQLDTGALLAKAILLFTQMEQSKVNDCVIPDVSESCINFAIWVQDNYSQSKRANTHDMLPKGQMRKDFTNDIYTMAEIWQHYNSR